MGPYFFPPAPGGWSSACILYGRYGRTIAFGLSHSNCMGFSAIYFVWQNICTFFQKLPFLHYVYIPMGHSRQLFRVSRSCRLDMWGRDIFFVFFFFSKKVF